MASSSSSDKPPNIILDILREENSEELNELEIRAQVYRERAQIFMLHPSSGRRNFSRVTRSGSTPSCPAQLSNFFVPLKDQIKDAIMRADKPEEIVSSSEPVTNR
ncbi:unnamed protein product [Adineta steineri]|uniref:Uncharacterized protein n=1 Tax=Adineta steineri TaxID=433720 RepID=A0A815GUM5_9BILA|nr:unnamed protein product [Adineta steineri]CAF3790673.1 unnamed protein product [Adineta steineri]